MLILGAHMSIGGGFAAAATNTGEKLGCNAMQIFTKSPRGGSVKQISSEDALAFRQECQKYGIKFVIAHSSYLLNFGKSIRDFAWMKHDIKLDFERLHLLGGNGVVVHIGKSLQEDRKKAVTNVIENAKKIVDETAKTGLDYIMENTAGQGSEIGYRLEELAEIWKELKGVSPRIRSCLDTAHLWGAGYDLSSAAAVKEVLGEYDQLIGLDTLACFHFNDSMKERGSRTDRHDNLGEGLIGLSGLKALAQFAVDKSIPMILETPEGSGKNHATDVALLKNILKK